eukprot:1904554-Pyramimonas_sp.AAC.1
MLRVATFPVTSSIYRCIFLDSSSSCGRKIPIAFWSSSDGWSSNCFCSTAKVRRMEALLDLTVSPTVEATRPSSSVRSSLNWEATPSAMTALIYSSGSHE